MCIFSCLEDVMKKKIIVVIFAAVFCCSLAAGLTACKKISHEHTYKTEVVAPNCTEQGYTLHTCTGCGDSYKDTYVSAQAHATVANKENSF